MIKSFKEIEENLFNDICCSFEEDYNFNSLRSKYSFIEYNVLWSILYSTGKYNEFIYNYLCQENIYDNKILLISDTHYGSIFENLEYIYSVFDFAVLNDIHIILHGGDILESNLNKRKGFNVIKQANYFIDIFPYDNNINTYALLGNHDYSAIFEEENVKNIICSRKDINILGYKKSYLNWCGNVISLQHEIEKFKLNLPIGAECLRFKGHSHFYHVKEQK